MPKNVRDLGKIIVAKGFEKLPKSNKLRNLVTLRPTYPRRWYLRVSIRHCLNEKLFVHD